MRRQELCAVCTGDGCVNCKGSGFVTVGWEDTPSGRLPQPASEPVTGPLRAFAWILIAGVTILTAMAYQNAPGSGQDKAFTAAIVFGVLGLGVIVLVRVLQFLPRVAALVLALGIIDHLANDG